MTKVFFYRGRWKFFAINALFIFLAVGLLIPAVFRDKQNTPVFIVALSLLCWFVLSGYLFTLASATVTVDREGISRSLFGHNLQGLRWRDVDSIREENVRLRNRRVSVVVIRVNGKSWGSGTGTVMTISERYDHFEELVDTLNEHVANESIPVEAKIDGIWQRVSKVRYQIEERNSYL